MKINNETGCSGKRTDKVAEDVGNINSGKVPLLKGSYRLLSKHKEVGLSEAWGNRFLVGVQQLTVSPEKGKRTDRFLL